MGQRFGFGWALLLAAVLVWTGACTASRPPTPTAQPTATATATPEPTPTTPATQARPSVEITATQTEPDQAAGDEDTATPTEQQPQDQATGDTAEDAAEQQPQLTEEQMAELRAKFEAADGREMIVKAGDGVGGVEAWYTQHYYGIRKAIAEYPFHYMLQRVAPEAYEAILQLAREGHDIQLLVGGDGWLEKDGGRITGAVYNAWYLVDLNTWRDGKLTIKDARDVQPLTPEAREYLDAMGRQSPLYSMFVGIYTPPSSPVQFPAQYRHTTTRVIVLVDGQVVGGIEIDSEMFAGRAIPQDPDQIRWKAESLDETLIADALQLMEPEYAASVGQK